MNRASSNNWTDGTFCQQGKSDLDRIFQGENGGMLAIPSYSAEHFDATVAVVTPWTDGSYDPEGSIDLDRTLSDDDGNTEVLPSFSVDHLTELKPEKRGEADGKLTDLFGLEDPSLKDNFYPG